MTRLKPSEIRKLSHQELIAKIQELKLELMRQRAAAMSSGVPRNPGRSRQIRRDIARLYTVLNQR